MSQAVNPNTNVPMTLQVEKIQQMRNVHDMQQQGQLAQKSELEKQHNQQRVNAQMETDEAKIRNGENNSKNNQEQNNKGKNKEKSKDIDEQPGTAKLKKGSIIDVSV